MTKTFKCRNCGRKDDFIGSSDFYEARGFCHQACFEDWVIRKLTKEGNKKFGIR